MSNQTPKNKPEYEEFIETFSFRDFKSIKIPKRIREKAYILAIDIKIETTKREPYFNFICTPPKTLYGRCTLVMQNFPDKEIELSLGRQRVYYGRAVEAFEFWDTLHQYEYERWYYNLLPRFFFNFLSALKEIELLSFLSPAIDLVLSILEIECFSLPDKAWVELPLREVYISPNKNTSYKIEVTWVQPKKFTDGCGNERDGKSFQTDGEKDNGLPNQSNLPKDNSNNSNPFDGADPESNLSDLGDFANSKGNVNDLNDGDLNNDGIPDNEANFGKFIKLSFLRTSSDNNCKTWDYLYHLLVADNVTSAYAEVTRTLPSCGGTTTEARIKDNFGVYHTGLIDYDSISITIIRAADKPADYQRPA